MLVTTTNDISGKNIQVLGFVQGSSVRTKDPGRAMAAGFRAFAGGENKILTDLMNEVRSTAYSRMIEQAQNIGADAIIAVRVNSCSVMDGASEVNVYGTAVKFI